MTSRGVEVHGETIEEAIQKGLEQLQVKRTEVAIEVIDEGSRGVLGIGKRDAIVRLALLDELENAPQAEQVVADDEVEDSVEEVEVEQPQAAVEKAAEPQTVPQEDESQVEPTLQQEADVAEQVVSTLIKKMGIDATVDVEIAPPDDMGQQIPVVNIRGDDLSMLIGTRGEVLNQFQLIVRSMVSQQISGRTHFVVDIGGYRSRREQTLAELAQRTANKAVKYRRPIALNPMPPHERRIIHMTLRDDDRVTTRSKGEGNRRRVRIIPTSGSEGNRRSNANGNS